MLRLGVGFWSFSLTNTGNISRDKKTFMIPEMYYERIKNSSIYIKHKKSLTDQGFSFTINFSGENWAFLKDRESPVENLESLQYRRKDCPSCGKEAEDDAIYCKYCGTVINKNNLTRYISDDIQRTVFERDNGQCVKCGRKDKLEFDHVIPLSRGGSNTLNNLQILCAECNRRKHNKIGG